ncbi:MAG: prolipoprotein diacylglyceryl transferase [Planctomycetes bacterium]|nr:prolipoprotein diacylglyceryl transferase [Planctomycetota bacterium]
MPTLAIYLHNLNPYAIKLWEGGPIRWYGLSYLLAFFLGYLVIRRVTRVGVSTLKPEHVGDLVITLALGVVIGGRVGYCLFYQPRLLGLIDHAPYWGVLAMNEGGMASHGGMIGGIVASWWYARRHKHSWPFILDLFAFGAPLGLFFGRIANFVNGELYGRPVPDGSVAMNWAVRFPQEMLHWNPNVPADNLKIEAVSGAIPFLPEIKAGYVFSGWEGQAMATLRAIQEGNAEVSRIVGPVLTPRHPSQLYEALLEGLVLFAVLCWLWRRPMKPGVIGGAFCVTYGLVRILGECFRTPDFIIADQEFAALGVTRGQWLSALLCLAGVVMILAFRRRNVEPMGGFCGKAANAVSVESKRS